MIFNFTEPANRPTVLWAAPVHAASELLLLDLELWEKVDEPLEAGVVSVDPEEVHLPQVEQTVDIVRVLGPLVAALWARHFAAPVPADM